MLAPPGSKIAPVVLALVWGAFTLGSPVSFGQEKPTPKGKKTERKVTPEKTAVKSKKKLRKLEGFHNGLVDLTVQFGRREAIFLDALYGADLDQSTGYQSLNLDSFPLTSLPFLAALGIGVEYGNESPVTTRVRAPDNEVLVKAKHERTELTSKLYYRLTMAKKNSLMVGLILVPYRQVDLEIQTDTGTFSSNLTTVASGQGYGVELGFNMLRSAYGRLQITASPLQAEVTNRLQDLTVKEDGDLALIETGFMVGIQNFLPLGRRALNIYAEAGITYREQTFIIDQIEAKDQVQTDFATLARLGIRLL